MTTTTRMTMMMMMMMMMMTTMTITMMSMTTWRCIWRQMRVGSHQPIWNSSKVFYPFPLILMGFLVQPEALVEFRHGVGTLNPRQVWLPSTSTWWKRAAFPTPFSWLLCTCPWLCCFLWFCHLALQDFPVLYDWIARTTLLITTTMVSEYGFTFNKNSYCISQFGEFWHCLALHAAWASVRYDWKKIKGILDWSRFCS